MGKRTWVKIYCDKWMEGSLRQEKPALRGVWADLLALCGGGEYSDGGEIKIRKDIGFTDPMLSRVLNITPQMWNYCKKRLIETERIQVNSDNILTIIHWKNYQSEYGRQKPQRTKSADDSATKSATKSAAIDNRVESIDNRVEKIGVSDFDTFWKAYPLRIAKGQAEKAFKRVNPSKELMTIIIDAIDKQKEWRERSTGFTPDWKHPATWLNAKGWEDDILEIKKKSKLGEDKWAK